MSTKYKILILGASYGSLLGAKLLLAGHNVKLVCLPAEADLINAEGIRVRMPVKGREGLVELDSRKMPGKIVRRRPARPIPADYDLVALAMQEPQYRSPGVRELLDAGGEGEGAVHVDHEHAAAALPEAHPRHRCRGLPGCYTDPTVWDGFDPAFMTLCSPDPQAFRPPEEKVNVLQVRLPTNFKSARFESDAHTAILRQLEADIEAIRFDVGGREDRAAGEAEGARLGVRAAGQVGDADGRQLPLRHQATACARSRTPCTATSTPRATCTTGW